MLRMCTIRERPSEFHRGETSVTCNMLARRRRILDPGPCALLDSFVVGAFLGSDPTV